MSEKLYTVYQVADLLGSTPGQILAWIQEGRITCRGDDGPRRIPQTSLVRFLKTEGIDIEQVLAKAVLGAAADGPPAADGDAPHAPADVRAVSDGLPRQADSPRAAAEVPADAFADAIPPVAGRYVADVVSRPAAGPRDLDGDARTKPAQPALDAELVAADPAERLAEAILKDAVDRRAGAIHLEPAEGGLALRLRVDGALQEKVNFRLRLPPAIAPGLVSHLTKRAGLAGDAASDHLSGGPQAGERSGRFTSRAGARFRLNVCPTQQGRRLVIFVEDADADRPALKDLGLEPGDLKTLRGLLRERSGLLLVTARPRGGASTTLRAMAGELACRHRSIFWLGPDERPPVEGASLIRLAGPSPSEGEGPPSDGGEGRPRPTLSLRERGPSSSALSAGAEAIRAAAGQDADLIVVGEIWDSQTLLAAAEAALAGSLVLGRLHERTAPAALELMLKAGLAPWRLATALLGVVAQTTVRKLCPACRREGQPSDAFLEGTGLRADDPARAGLDFPTFVPVGCKQCFNTGYAGRTGVFSILEVRDELASLLRDGAGLPALSDAAARAGMKALPLAAMDLARRGVTSLEELGGGRGSGART